MYDCEGVSCEELSDPPASVVQYLTKKCKVPKANVSEWWEVWKGAPATPWRKAYEAQFQTVKEEAEAEPKDQVEAAQARKTKEEVYNRCAKQVELWDKRVQVSSKDMQYSLDSLQSWDEVKARSAEDLQKATAAEMEMIKAKKLGPQVQGLAEEKQTEVVQGLVALLDKVNQVIAKSIDFSAGLVERKRKITLSGAMLPDPNVMTDVELTIPGGSEENQPKSARVQQEQRERTRADKDTSSDEPNDEETPPPVPGGAELQKKQDPGAGQLQEVKQEKESP